MQSGGATGTSAQNNALSINNAAETVANFRQQSTPPPPLPATPPGVPTGLRSTISGSTVTLAWNAVTSDWSMAADPATSYRLQVGNAPGTSNLFSQNVGNTTSVSGTVPAGTYFWRVVAMNGAGQSAPSSEATFTVGACIAPGAPQAVTSSVAGNVVTLSWMPPASGTVPVSYVLEAGSASSLANLYNGPIGALTSLTVAVPRGTYFVRVRAQNACGVGPTSAERVVVVP
jgi:hypothetical protein